MAGKQGVVFEAIIEEVYYDADELFDDLIRRLRNIQETARRDFKRTTKDWEIQPVFFVTSIRERDTIGLFGGTEDFLYHLIDQGTRPHVINRKRTKVMAFNIGYTAKTQPGILSSRPGGKGSGATFFMNREFLHPGTEPRGFAKAIALKMEKRIAKDLPEVVESWVSTTHRRIRRDRV